MNLGQNKFFAGFGAVIAIGCIGLGWLAYSSYSAYDEASTDFEAKVQKLKELQNLPLYPEKANVKILQEQEKTAQDSVSALHQKLVPMTFPLEPLTPEQFQDQLNAAVKNLSEKAAAAGVIFPEKQNLGFEQYRTSVPKPEAAAALGRQLKCIELAVATMIDRKVSSIENITRPLLPEENETPKTEAPVPVKGRKKGKPQPKAQETPSLLAKSPFSIKFVGGQQAFQGVINDLTKSTSQFYIIENVRVENQMTKPPKRGDAPNAKKTSKPASKDKKQAGQMQYVFGAEKLNVTLDLDSVVFASNLPK